MKKRLRKKLHRGEFQQYGISLMVPVTEDTIETTLNTITEIADKYQVIFCGGGLDRFIMPSEEYRDLDIPDKIEFLIMTIALSPETISDCIIGYFSNPIGQEISVETADKIKVELESSLNMEFKINCRIGLWK